MTKESVKERKADIQAAVAEVVAGTLTLYGAAKKYDVDRSAISRVIIFNQRMKDHEPVIRKLYPTTDTEDLATELALTMTALNRMASILGVVKNKGFKRKKRRVTIYRYDEIAMVKTSINLGKLSAVFDVDAAALAEAGLSALAELAASTSKMLARSKSVEDVGHLTLHKW